MTFALTESSARISAADGRSAAGLIRSAAHCPYRPRRSACHAVSALFARHQVPVYRFILRFVRDESHGRGCAERSASSDVWRQAALAEGRSSVSTWLLAIARFKALSARRRRVDAELDTQDRRARCRFGRHAGNCAGEEGHRRISCPAARPKLSPGSKARSSISPTITRRSVTEVAEIVGIPEATVKTRMFYARRKLAQLVQAA